jgi:hypothetical protein
MKTWFAALVALLLAATPAAAQIRAVGGPAQHWFSGWTGRYMSMGRVADPASNSVWAFAESWLVGAGYHRSLGPGLHAGIDVSYAAPRYERRVGNQVVADGRATILTPVASGRLNYGGAGPGIAFYLTGAIGAVVYRMPDLDRTDTDFALYAGTGIEYQFDPRRSAYLEWGQYWAYHEGDGLESNRANHSLIRLGLRFGR